MALKEEFMIKSVIGDTDLELEAKAGTSLLVKDIYIYNPKNDYIEVTIERESVGYFRVGGSLGSHLPFPFNPLKHSHPLKASTVGTGTTLNHIKIVDADGTGSNALIGLYDATSITVDNALQYDYTPQLPKKTILGYAREKGWFTGFPIGEGEKMTITGAKQSGAIQCVVYEEYDAGDMTPEMPNGSASKEHFYILYGYPSADVTNAGDHEVNTNRNPRPYPKFPFTDKCPANTEIDILGICGSEVMDKYSATDYVRTKYLKLWYEEEVLFDKDKNGLLFYGEGQTVIDRDDIAMGYSVVGNYTDKDGREPFVFPVAKTFVSGEQLVTDITVETSTTVTNAEITKTNLEIGYLVKYRKV